MKSVDAHLAECLQGIEPLGALDVPLLDAQGCILAEDVVSSSDVPRFDRAGYDGYAVRLADVAAAADGSPVVLPVVGDVAVGRAPVVSVQHGFAARVMAGAPVPPGTEAIVPDPWTDGGIARVEIRQGVAAGQGIEPVGGEVRDGEIVLRAGELIGAGHLGLLAAIGRSRATVRPRPRIVVLSTGDALVEPGTRPEPGQVFEANSYVLTSQAKEAGGLAFRVGIVPDDPRRLVDSIEDQLVRADLVVTTGGTSERAYAVIREVLTGIGTVEFEHLAMTPGQAQGHGTIGPDSTPLFTLPGDPVGSYVSFEVFVRPVIRRMLGLSPLNRPVVRAVCVEAFSSPAGLREFARGTLGVEHGRYVVRPVRRDGARGLIEIDGTNTLIVVPESTTHVAEGDSVEVMVLERRHG
jgi:molybdopterin molybdotransferase